jgi:hypothetical protein
MKVPDDKLRTLLHPAAELRAMTMTRDSRARRARWACRRCNRDGEPRPPGTFPYFCSLASAHDRHNRRGSSDRNDHAARATW